MESFSDVVVEQAYPGPIGTRLVSSCDAGATATASHIAAASDSGELCGAATILPGNRLLAWCLDAAEGLLTLREVNTPLSPRSAAASLGTYVDQSTVLVPFGPGPRFPLCQAFRQRTLLHSLSFVLALRCAY